MVRSVVNAVVAGVLLLVPASAHAVTVRDVVALTQSGVSEAVLVALIDADQTIFTLSAEQVLELTRAGVSDVVIRKMLGSRREFEPAPPPPPEPATPEDLSRYVVITGESPDTVPRHNPPYYYGLPYPVFVAPGILPGRRVMKGNRRTADDPTGFGRFINDGTRPFLNDGTRPFLNDGWIGPPFQGTTPPRPRPSPRGRK